MTRAPNSLLVTVLLALGACGSNSTPPPAGSCRAATTTGSFTAACTTCAKASCDTEQTAKSGPGWADGYTGGGEGACAAYNECQCGCVASSRGDINALLTCTLSTCTAVLDQACQAAITSATRCLVDRCPNECG
jgi:hypothetical protein